MRGRRAAPAWRNITSAMQFVVQCYRFFASLRMTTKRKRAILSKAKNLYTPFSRDIQIEALMLRHTIWLKHPGR